MSRVAPLAPGARIDEVESAFRTVCEPIFNKPLSEISFAQVLMRLFRVAQRFNVEIQPQLILLEKGQHSPERIRPDRNEFFEQDAF